MCLWIHLIILLSEMQGEAGTETKNEMGRYQFWMYLGAQRALKGYPCINVYHSLTGKKLSLHYGLRHSFHLMKFSRRLHKLSHKFAKVPEQCPVGEYMIWRNSGQKISRCLREDARPSFGKDIPQIKRRDLLKRA